MKMIKKLLLILLIIVSSKTINAQLKNTSWKGDFMVPQPAECIMVFKEDTSYLVFASGFNPDKIDPDNILETMSYKIDHDTLSLQKLSGNSPCSEDIIGKYSFAIKNDLMYIHLIDDDCPQRASAFPSETLTRVENKE